MNERYISAALAILLSWVAWGIAALVMPSTAALLVALPIGAAVALLLRDTIVLRGVVAIFDPIGIVLPLLIVRQMASGLGVPFEPFGTLELIIFLIVYLTFLTSSFDVFPADPYRLGYSPAFVAAIVLGLCVFGWVTGNAFIPFIAVTGQVMWVFKIGSSNYFDHILHVMLVPVAVIELIFRIIA